MNKKINISISPSSKGNSLYKIFKNTITKEYLESMGFEYNEKSSFENINIQCYAKDAILLFFNTSNDNTFLIGHGEYFFGKYYINTFRWIYSKEELHDIYRAVKGKELEAPKNKTKI